MSMPLPNILTVSLQAARSAIDSDSEHTLSPAYRKKLYQSFAALARPQARAGLAIMTARYVLPLWQLEQPEDLSALQAIEHGDLLLRGRGDINTAKEFAGRMWEVLDELGGTSEGLSMGNGFYAAQAAVSALYEVLGRDPFGDIEIVNIHSDADLDPWSSDTALWGAAAYAGRVGDPTSDEARRHLFWTWWLADAVPMAWNASATRE